MNEIDREMTDKLISPNDLTNAEKNEDGVPVTVYAESRRIASLRKLWLTTGALTTNDIERLFDASALFAEWMREQHEAVAALRDERDRLERIVREILSEAAISPSGQSFWMSQGHRLFVNFEERDWPRLRQLIESEEGQ